MRKLILLVLISAMLFGGLSVLLDELLIASRIRLQFVVAGGVLAFAGGYLLWTDFIAPRLRIKTWED